MNIQLVTRHVHLNYYENVHVTTENKLRLYRRCGFDPWVRKIPWRKKYACLSRCPRGERPLVELYLKPGVFSERCTEKLPLRVDFIHRGMFINDKAYTLSPLLLCFSLIVMMLLW